MRTIVLVFIGITNRIKSQPFLSSVNTSHQQQLAEGLTKHPPEKITITELQPLRMHQQIQTLVILAVDTNQESNLHQLNQFQHLQVSTSLN